MFSILHAANAVLTIALRLRGARNGTVLSGPRSGVATVVAVIAARAFITARWLSLRSYPEVKVEEPLLRALLTGLVGNRKREKIRA